MSKSKKIIERIPEGEAILDQIDFTTEEYSNACKKMAGEYRRLIKFILSKFNVKDGSKILEIGPGPGWIGILIAKQNSSLKIIGLELSKDMIRVANKNKKDEGVDQQISYVHGNAEYMYQFLDNSFDLVFGNGTLHHWENPIKIFNEISRVLKSHGVFCISDGRRDIGLGAKVIFHIVKLFIPKFMRIGWKTSINAGYTPKELTQILDQSNLKNNYELKTDLFDIKVYNKTY
ncbi:MAG: class I SAM-dependent methyltransferase [Promethearchaeota archaeon]